VISTALDFSIPIPILLSPVLRSSQNQGQGARAARPGGLASRR